MEAVVDVTVPHAGFALRGTRVSPEGSMKNNFEATRFLPTGVPVSVDRSGDLKSAAVEEGPTHEEIQKRAYELSLKSREEFSAHEYVTRLTRACSVLGYLK